MTQAHPTSPRHALVRSSPLGPLRLVATDDALVELRLEPEGAPELRLAPEGTPDRGRAHPLLARASAELDEYFAGERTGFDVPLAPRGTPFQREVWAALRRIRCGETRSYADLAREVGRPRAVRAVGEASGANPIAIVIPCHRVVGSDGSLTGYAGGLVRKRWLLAREGAARTDFDRTRASPAPGGGRSASVALHGAPAGRTGTVELHDR